MTRVIRMREIRIHRVRLKPDAQAKETHSKHFGNSIKTLRLRFRLQSAKAANESTAELLRSPADATPGAVAAEMNEWSGQCTIQLLNRVVQVLFWIDAGFSGQRVIDASWPTGALEACQHQFHIGRGPSELLDHHVAHAKQPLRLIPVGHSDRSAWVRTRVFFGFIGEAPLLGHWFASHPRRALARQSPI